MIVEWRMESILGVLLVTCNEIVSIRVTSEIPATRRTLSLIQSRTGEPGSTYSVHITTSGESTSSPVEITPADFILGCLHR